MSGTLDNFNWAKSSHFVSAHNLEQHHSFEADNRTIINLTGISYRKVVYWVQNVSQERTSRYTRVGNAQAYVFF